MKAKELSDLLLKHPDFEVRFTFSEEDNSDYGLSVRTFILDERSIDLGYSSKIFSLGGTER